MKYLLIYFLLLSQNVICQNVPPDFKKVVAFIFIQNDSGEIIPNGSGFYVAVNQGKDSTKGYIVTAKHVLKKQDGTFFNKIFIRLPKRNDSSLVTVKIDLNISGRNKNVFVHSDTTVDIAVISSYPRQNQFDFLFLPTSFLTTRENFDSLHITEGDEVFFTGMFSQYLGEKANYPISRFGRVSLITNEKVFWNGNYRNLYLLEATTYWGNSGSPVYFSLQRAPKQQPNMIITGTETIIKLAGIMSGFFGQNVPGGFMQTNLVPYNLVNFGISAVTPSYLLYEILFSKEVKESRGF
jgi:hypothetical protein